MNRAQFVVQPPKGIEARGASEYESSVHPWCSSDGMPVFVAGTTELSRESWRRLHGKGGDGANTPAWRAEADPCMIEPSLLAEGMIEPSLLAGTFQHLWF